MCAGGTYIDEKYTKHIQNRYSRFSQLKRVSLSGDALKRVTAAQAQAAVTRLSASPPPGSRQR